MTTNTQRVPAHTLRISEALSWRWRLLLPRIKRRFGVPHDQWCRVVMNRRCHTFVRSLPYESMDALEVSGVPGSTWSHFGFGSYRCTSYPDYDICSAPLAIEGFDLVIAEQVLEHVRLPAHAVRHVHQMLKRGGWFLVSTPFLLRVHAIPDDYHRWTEHGLKQLLIDGGFAADAIETGSWGNRACVRANFTTFPYWIPGWHSLRNEALFPVVVWAFAKRSAS